MRISDWSSDVCSSDLFVDLDMRFLVTQDALPRPREMGEDDAVRGGAGRNPHRFAIRLEQVRKGGVERAAERVAVIGGVDTICGDHRFHHGGLHGRSEEHTSELQPLMRTSYDVLCLKNK